jgi:hypothetical protein
VAPSSLEDTISFCIEADNDIGSEFLFNVTINLKTGNIAFDL